MSKSRWVRLATLDYDKATSRYQQIKFVYTNILLTKSKLKIESRASAVRRWLCSLLKSWMSIIHWPSQWKWQDFKHRDKISLQWRYNERDGVSNHQPHDCLLNNLFRRRSNKTSKIRITGLCEVNPPVIGGIPSQWASNAENVSIWWRHRAFVLKEVGMIFSGIFYMMKVWHLFRREFPRILMTWRTTRVRISNVKSPR